MTVVRFLKTLGALIPETWLLIGGVLFTVFVSLWAEGLSKSFINLIIRVFHVGGKRGPVGTELAARMLAAAGENGVRIDRTALDTDFRLAFNDIDYRPLTDTLELTEDKADATTFSSAGLVTLEVGRALQYRRGFFPVRLQNLLTKPVNLAGFVWVYPLVGANVLPALLPGRTGAAASSLCWTAAAICLGLILAFVLLKIPVDLDAARRGVNAMEDAGVFSTFEKTVIILFLGALLAVTIFTTLLIGFSIFRSTIRSK